LVVPPDLLPIVLGRLQRAPEVTNLWHVAEAVLKPPGDLVSCDVAKEEGSRLVAELRELGLDQRGSIAVEDVDASISRGAVAAEQLAPGSPADAVVWEEVESRLSESAVLSVSFLLLMTLATLIAAVGIVTDSIVLIIGAMVVGPEYGPIAGVCVAIVERRPREMVRSLQALLVGFPLAIAAAGGLTLALIAAGFAPEALGPTGRDLTIFISRPNWASVIVAVLAGLAGMLAVISAKSGALIGVLISITTIPAAANVGVAIAYANWGESGGAAVHLAINLAALLASGLVVLTVAARSRRRRRSRHDVSSSADGPSPD
jgi:uncharacterized hydrophobic protein (TIGR00271 family)